MTEAEELRLALEALRAAHCDAGGSACDYAGLGASREKQRLAETLAALGSFDPKRVLIAAQTAFWLNVFNAIVVRDAPELARAHGPREVERFFESARATIGARTYSLDEIEHGLLRGNVPKFGGMRAPLRQGAPRHAGTLRAAPIRRPPTTGACPWGCPARPARRRRYARSAPACSISSSS